MMEEYTCLEKLKLEIKAVKDICDDLVYGTGSYEDELNECFNKIEELLDEYVRSQTIIGNKNIQY